jgi:negative regulator of sigma E activity
VFVLVLQNLPDLVGGSTPVAVGAVVLLVVVFGVGAGIAAKRSQVTLE